MILCIALVITAAVVAVNVVIDPFSVFGDKLFEWYSYGMTNNPKTAKYVYIDEHAGEYDAFIIGPSGASSFDPEAFEKYTGYRWYNMFNYGADMEYTKRLAEYLIEIHQPEMLLLTVPVVSATAYTTDISGMVFEQPLRPLWKLKFLFANPHYSVAKVRSWLSQSYLQQSFDVFNAESGTYNKTRRDAEAINSPESYYAAYPEFVNMAFWKTELTFIEENAEAIEFILELADRYGTEVIIVTTPMLAEEMGRYYDDEIRAFYARIAEASGGFWDFSFSEISGDVRYFYDTTHFRNSVGDMIAARIFGDDSIYIPDDLGIRVTPGNSIETAEKFIAFEPEENPTYERTVPILRYHDIAEEEGFISPALFAEHMRALYEAGFTAIPLSALYDFVHFGAELPERPVVITFDGGYLGSYTHGFPVLLEYGFHATFFVTGVFFGEDTHLPTGSTIRPRFGAVEAREMVESGLVSVQSHTYDLHQTEGLYPNPRRGVLQMDGESESAYIDTLRNDHELIAGLIRNATGEEILSMAYPFGISDRLSAVVYRNAGVLMTLSATHDNALVIRGLPQSLLEMSRFTFDGDTTGDMMVRIIQG